MKTGFFGLTCGRDYYFWRGWLLVFCAFRRPAKQGELRWRICLELNISLDPVRFLTVFRFWPAWRDEPTALAEYELTMRRRGK
ncbi:MAG: hypothetical protein EOS63_17370 [Mesorhizobium sp.]|uniref:hypothetical protein n=1 Tax=Mesorhizobium sp. TaxID=1871066 RepID=UPI000FE6360A|nr:hypothetical protein [Mesorhizobium sp.]RWE78525.1 MAG: hypothetical protein EOS63_17370 [Mesorhizobium sp.]TJW61025.1 MAG: hypothetical protein E5V97_22175 [Mesorhizobium sp.]